MNFGLTGIGRTHTPGVFKRGASPYGAHDTVGNVLEWTRDVWSANYPDGEDERRNLAAPAGTNTRVLRGGSFRLSAWVCRCAYRVDVRPHARDFNVGFRLVLRPLSL